MVTPKHHLSSSALVYDNVVEDNTRVGIFFHRSTDYAEAYGNTCKRNLEGDIGIFESTGVKIHDNVSEASFSGPKYRDELELLTTAWGYDFDRFQHEYARAIHILEIFLVLFLRTAWYDANSNIPDIVEGIVHMARWLPSSYPKKSRTYLSFLKSVHEP